MSNIERIFAVVISVLVLSFAAGAMATPHLGEILDVPACNGDFNSIGDTSASISPVPEPATIAMLGLSSLVLFRTRSGR